MKQGIHPEYIDATIICGCGNRIETKSTQPEIHVEICSVCHPFYTGKQRLVDTAGRVERFNRKYGKQGKKVAEEVEKKEEAGVTVEAADLEAGAGQKPSDVSTEDTAEIPEDADVPEKSEA